MSKNVPQHPDDVRRLHHDLVSPLTAIYCLTQDLLKRSTLSKSQRHLLQLIFTAAEEANQQLTWRTDPATRQEKESFVVKTFLRQLKSNLQCPYPSKIDVHTTNLDRKKIYGNPQLLKLALTHLINNSCEAYPVACSDRDIKIYAHPYLNGVLIMINDHGQGIHWWKKMLIGFKNISFKKTKSGLGLWEAKRIITQEYGGQLKIISQQNIGTQVSVYLPS